MNGIAREVGQYLASQPLDEQDRLLEQARSIAVRFEQDAAEYERRTHVAVAELNEWPCTCDWARCRRCYVLSVLEGLEL